MTCTISSVRQVWSPLWSLQVQNAPLDSRASPTGERFRGPPNAPSRVHSGGSYGCDWAENFAERSGPTVNIDKITGLEDTGRIELSA